MSTSTSTIATRLEALDIQPQQHLHSQVVQIETSKYHTDGPKLTLQWSHLSLKVKIKVRVKVNVKAKVKNAQTKEVVEKTILNDVSGSARPGELLVIMGPSGAGKSSLLDCISGRNRDVDGSITVNGQPWSKQMKRLTSYVMQDDLFYQTITVREHLVFQAKLRLGKSFTKAQYGVRVDAVMEELGLMKCRDTLIGGPSLRGISGGERKRLSFATEILTNPSILFVDEPTSGLDSFMAEAVVTQLQQIARDGRTVIATIHQPSSELFALFDQLYLLSDGATVYHGKGSDAVAYFASLGYQCPPFLNPSDYFMRQLVVLDKATDTAGVARVEGLKDAWRQRQLELGDGHTTGGEHGNAGVEVVFSNDKYADSRLRSLDQVAVLATRNSVRILRDKTALRVAVAQMAFIALVIGLIYLQLDLNQTGIQNFSGVLFFITMNQTFSAGNATFISVPLELPIVMREYRAGLYRLVSWYIAKNVSELIMQILLPIVFFVPAYLLVGFGHGFETYVSMQVVFILINSSAVGVGYMVSCMTRRVDLAPFLGNVVILPLLIFGGLFINSADCPSYFLWIQYISPIKYGYEALMKIFWNQVDSIPCNEAIENCVAHTGAQVLQNFSVTEHSAVVDLAILFAINVGFRIIGFVSLWWNLRKTK